MEEITKSNDKTQKQTQILLFLWVYRLFIDPGCQNMKQKSPNKDKNLHISPSVRPEGPAARDSGSCALEQSQIGSIRQTPILCFPRCHSNHFSCHSASKTLYLGLWPWKQKSVETILHIHLQTGVHALWPPRCFTKRITVVGGKDGLAGINRRICE